MESTWYWPKIVLWGGIAFICLLIPLAASVISWRRPAQASMRLRFFAGLHGVLILAALTGALLISPFTVRQPMLQLPLLGCLAVVVIVALASSITGLVVHRRSLSAVALIIAAAPIELLVSVVALMAITHFGFRTM